MDLSQKIIEQFESNADLKVLFFFDKEQEWAEEIKTLKTDNVEIVDAEKAHFGLKIRLEHEMHKQKVMLYFPYGKPISIDEKKKFILLDLLIANRELILDDTTDFMTDFNLLPHQRIIAKKYIKELKKMKHQKVLVAVLNQQLFEESKIIQGLICSFLGFDSVVGYTQILSKIFILTIPENKATFTKFIKQIQREEYTEALQYWLSEYLDISKEDLTAGSFITAFRKMKYNLLVQHINTIKPNDSYKKLRIDNMITMQLVNAIKVDWENHPKLSKDFNKVMKVTGAEIKEEKLIELYGIDTEFMFYTERMKFLILAENVKILQGNPEKISKALQRLSVGENEAKELRLLVSYLGYVSQYFTTKQKYSNFVFDTPEEYVNRYSEEIYELDFIYRKALSILDEINKLTLPEEIQLDDLTKSFHKSYEDYLVEINREWMGCMKENSYQFNKIDVLKQYEFYSHYLEESDRKVAVIISDALRYESAYELLSELLGDPKGNAKIEPMLASIPSTTKWGMSNLLTNQKLKYKDDKIWIGDIHTEGIGKRSKILKSLKRGAEAVSYDKLMKKEREEQRELFKKQLVFVYHNHIDAVGDDRKSEMKTFKAVSETIEDLRELVKKVHSSFNVSRVIITSDHGFIFNYRELTPASYQQKPDGNHIAEHNRYLITKDSEYITNSHLMNLSDTANIDTDLKVAVPKTINRYKRQGAGMHFVHGGSSLQELVVPVVISQRKRADINERVPFKLMNELFKLVSGAIKVQIYQVEPLGQTAKARELVVGLYSSSGELVSNESTLLLGSISQLPTERKQEIILNLNNQSSQDEIMYLKVYDADDTDKLNPVIEEKVINKTLIGSDF